MQRYTAEEYGRLADTFQRALDDNRAKIMEPEMVISALRIASRATEEGLREAVHGYLDFEKPPHPKTTDDMARAILKHLHQED